MALTNYYVDPVNGSDTTGNGTSGTPWKTTQNALNTIVQGAGGDQINIKSTGDDVLSATLSLATYGTPTSAKPLIFSGYTSSANDGGIGGISGNSGGFTILTSSAFGIGFINMHLHHTGASPIVTLASGQSIIAQCELDHGTSGASVTTNQFTDNYVHDVTGTTGVSCSGAFYNYLDGRSGSPTTQMLSCSNANENTILLSGSNGCNGIISSSNQNTFERNSVFGNGGTGKGIHDSGNPFCTYLNNIVEGFSGAGGKGFSSTGHLGVSAGNRAYNNTTNYSYSPVPVFQGTDATDSSTNFNNAAGGDLTLKSGSPAISTSSTPAGYPGTYKGSSFKSYADQGAFQYPPSSAVAGLGAFIGVNS